MSESLRNDGRVWVPKSKADCEKQPNDSEDDRDYFLERKYPSFGNLAWQPALRKKLVTKAVCWIQSVYLILLSQSNVSANSYSRTWYGNP